MQLPRVRAKKLRLRADELASDQAQCIRYLREELQAERANQAAILASIYCAAAALLAFDGVFLLIALASGAAVWARVLATVLAVWSAYILARSLFFGPKTEDSMGRTYREGNLAVIDPDLLTPMEDLNSYDALLQLYATEKELVASNLYDVIDPQRARVLKGAQWFIGAVLAIGAGELQQLIEGWLK